MKALAFAVALTACGSGVPTHDPGPDAGTHPDGSTGVDAPPAEPKPSFTAGIEISGQLAIDDAGIRPTFIYQGTMYLSVVQLSLTQAGQTTSCGVTLAPHFVQFGSASTSTRSFKTVVLDFAGSQVVEDKCHWDDAWILSQLAAEFGNYVVGFAQARFASDRPNVDTFFDAAMGFGDTANIVRAGGGTAFQMGADGTVTDTVVEPAPGTLVPALYQF